MAVTVELTKSADDARVFMAINWKSDWERSLKYLKNKL